MAHQVQLFINGEFVPSKSERFIPVNRSCHSGRDSSGALHYSRRNGFCHCLAKEAFKSWKECAGVRTCPFNDAFCAFIKRTSG